MDFLPVTRAHFLVSLEIAQGLLPEQLALNLGDLPEDARCFVNPYSVAGFAVTDDGELVNVFSLLRGRGDAIMRAAIAEGATHLNCYDGYLPGFYARHGFEETHRVAFDDQYAPAGWAFGRPDVVFMRRK